jgi:hypothetical protein
MSEGGSGAGAEVTALNESLQAYACATRAFLKRDLIDVSEITNKTIGDADCDRKLEACMKGLNEKYFHSVVVTANKIFKDFPEAKNGYKFYRGGQLVDQIYKEFGRFRKGSGITGDDKWNPADIWMAKKTFKFKDDWPSLQDYNEYILDQYKKSNLVGISLKMVPKGDVSSKVYNDGKPVIASFRGFKLGQNMTDSKDIYIQLKSEGKDGEIQLRNFSSRPVTSSWQGEIKGKTAAGGKIGGGIVMTAALESGVPSNKLMLPSKFATLIEKPGDAVFKEFAMMFKDISGSKDKIEVLVAMAKAGHRRDKVWWMSKYLGVAYCYAIKKAKKEEEVTKWLFGYGSSATKNSSIFIKYS